MELVEVNGRQVECLYDTGLDGEAVISADLVHPEQFTGETLDIQPAQKSAVTMKLPIANVEIRSRYVTGTIKAAVLTDPIFPVILGCRYVFLGMPREPIHMGAMQTRSQTKTEEADAIVTNPMPGELRTAQSEDDTLRPCYKKLQKSADPPGRGQYYMKNRILYRRAGRGDNLYGQLVVPKAHRSQILHMGHTISFSGHMGIAATMQRISCHYYWPGMTDDVRRYVKSCPECQRVAPKHWTAPVVLGEMPIMNSPFERVAIDIVGPLPRTRKRNMYILTMVDCCTMWGEAIPLTTIDSKRVADALMEAFTRLGFPDQILTDNGSQFCGKLMEEVFRVFHSNHIHTSPYHPQANGQVERFNGTLMTMLRKLAQEKPDRWDEYIPAALFAYREVPHGSTGLPPATLLFGRPIKGPLEAMLRSWTEEGTSEEVISSYQYVEELKEKLHKGWTLANQNLKKARKRHAAYYNRRSKERSLEVGDKVLLLLPTGNNKLEIGWQGPFPVERVISRTNYQIRIRGKSKIFHINLLRKYEERPGDKAAHLMAMAVAVETEVGTSEGREYPLVHQETYRDVQVNPDLTSQERERITQVLKSHKEILTDKPGRTRLVEFEMTLTTQEPVRQKVYPVPFSKEKALEEEIQKLLEDDVIAPSTSPYNAGVVLLRKPSGEHRLCIDYRLLNSHTQFQVEPLPNPTQLFARLHKARYFSKVDLSRGYYQIPVKPEIRPLLAFSTPSGHYEFKVMPFGLSNAPSVFTRMMRTLLDPLQDPSIISFMDDILISSDSLDDHLQSLERVFNRLKEAGLTARPTKCMIGYQTLEFLGHTITPGHIVPEEKNLEKIRNAPRPKTKKDVRSFLSLCGFYHKFIPHFTELGAPLTETLKKGFPDQIIWTPECENAYSQLKEALVSKPVLQLPDLSKPFVLRTDASAIGIGAALLQEGKDDASVLKPVAYASKKLLQAERNYSTVERECLSLVWAVQKFQPYLYGVKFRVQSDHQPLMFLATSQKLNARLMRWSLLLQPYNFTVEYIPGKENVGADFLSRHPAPEEEE